MTTMDPKEIKILSDILALVLEDHPGQSSTALETLRRRAQRNGTTGGALKNLFQVLAAGPPEARGAQRPPPRSSSTRARQETPDTYRNQLREMTESLTRLDRNLKTVTAQNEALKAELYLTQQSRAELQSHIATSRLAGRNKQRLTVVAAILAGLLTGIAGAEVFHAIDPVVTPHMVDRRHTMD